MAKPPATKKAKPGAQVEAAAPDLPNYIFELPEPPVSKEVRDEFERNLLIVQLRTRGMRWTSLAREMECSLSTVHRVYAAYCRLAPGIAQADPLTIVNYMTTGYESLIEDYLMIARKAEDGDNFSVLIGALNGKRAAYADMMVMLQNMGALPHDLGKLRHIVDGRLAATTIIDVLDRHGVSMDVKREIHDALIGDRYDADGTASLA